MTRLLPLFLVLALAACSSERDATIPDAATPTEAVAYDPDAPLSDASIYAYDAPWTTDADETVTLTSFRGRPVALAMVYADCGTACPLIVNDMKTLGEHADGAGLQYVLVTLDPERDTAEHLRSFRQMHGLGDDWTLLRGTPDDIQTLAALLNVRYRAETDGTIAHSNLITLLDAGGAPVARQEGLGTDPAPAVAALHAALALNS